MSILDKLMERKTLALYLKLRLEELETNDNKCIMRLAPQRREAAFRQVKGRIKEVHHLQHLLAHNQIKAESKRLYRRLRKRNHFPR